MKLKKVFGCVFTLGVLLVLLFLTTEFVDTGMYNIYEYLLYAVIGVFSLALWNKISFKNTSKKLLINSFWALGFTAVIFLINNLLHFIKFNNMFNWVDPCPLWVFMKSDITYTQGIGLFRYPFVFALLFSANIIIPVIIQKSKSSNSRRKGIIEKLCITEDDICDLYSDKSDLEILVNLYLKEKIGETAIYEYCKTLTDSEKDIAELTKCMDSSDVKILYDIFFEKYKETATEEMMLKYTEKYKEKFKEQS